MTAQVPRALVVDDDSSWQQLLSEILADCGLEVDVARDTETAVEALTAASHKLAELMYAQASQDNPDMGGSAGGDAGQEPPKDDKGDDDVVDADFEEVK